MIPIYVASRGSESGCARVRRVIDLLAPHGFRATFDWTIDMLANFAAGRRDHDLSFEEKKAYAQKDAKAVREAQIVIYLEDEKSEGSASEVGIAIGTDKMIYASCPGTPRCLFACLADRIFKTDDELVAALIGTLDRQHSAR